MGLGVLAGGLPPPHVHGGVLGRLPPWWGGCILHIPRERVYVCCLVGWMPPPHTQGVGLGVMPGGLDAFAAYPGSEFRCAAWWDG